MGRSTHEIDWEGVERAYRLGQDTVTKISKDYKVAESAIRRRAKKEVWTRDLGEQVKASTKAKVQQRVAEESRKRVEDSAKADSDVVELNAISNALLLAEHERGAAKGRELMAKILGRIEAQLETVPESIEKMIEAAGDDDNLRMQLRRVTQIPSLVDSAKKAIEGHAKAVEQERKARNLDDQPPPPDQSGFEALLERMAGVSGDDA